MNILRRALFFSSFFSIIGSTAKRRAFFTVFWVRAACLPGEDAKRLF